MSNVHQLRDNCPQNIEYHGTDICIEYRPKTNDYGYLATRKIVLTLRGHANSYEKCLEEAQQRIDNLTPNEGG